MQKNHGQYLFYYYEIGAQSNWCTTITFIVSKKIWNTKEDKGKSMMSTSHTYCFMPNGIS